MADEANKNKIDPEQARREGEMMKNALKEAPGMPGMIGKGVDVADKLTGGKGSEMLGNAAHNAIGKAPQSRMVKNATNGPRGEGLGEKEGLTDDTAGLGKPNPADAVKGVDGLGDKSSDLGLPENKNNSLLGGLKNKISGSNSKSSSSTNNPDEEGLEGDTTDIKLFEVPSKIKLAFLGIAGGFIILLLPILLIVAIFTSIGDVAVDFFNGIGDKFVSFFEGMQYTTEENFYKEIDKVRKNILNKEGICIDANLIIAALTANRDFDEALENGEEDVESEEGQSYTKKMQKQIALLGAMQVKHSYYSLDQKATYKCGTGEKVPVTEENKDSFKIDWKTWFTTNDADYLVKNIAMNSPRAIANNDKDLNVNFFNKKVSEEMNYAYYIYYPPVNTDGTCSEDYAKKKLKEMNSDSKAELDIGTIATMKDSVFYWNLVDQFIPDYYEDYLPKEAGAERTDAIFKLADDIYALYETMGPNQNCSNGGVYSYSCSYNIGNTDVTNIKVKLMDNDYNDLDEDLLSLEDYVAGVVYGENGYISSENTEALRAQAIAARSYLLKRTQGMLKDYITTTDNGTTILAIRNSTSDQVYCNPHTGCYIENNVYHSADSSHPATKVALTAAQMEMLNNALAAVTGQVLVDGSGDIIQTGYDSSVQEKWNDLSKAGSDYQSILMETYESAEEINSNCVISGSGYGGGSVNGMFTGIATECNSFFTYGDPFYWGDPVNNQFKYGTYNPFQSYGIQCTWYTYGRALKALVEYGNLTVTEARKKLFFSSNAGEWWQENLGKADDVKFQYSSNINDVREGAIVVWIGGIQGVNAWCSSINDYCGHVAFVERVVRNLDGSIKEVSVSQANPDKCKWTTYTSLESFNRNGATRGNRHIAGYIYLFNR